MLSRVILSYNCNVDIPHQKLAKNKTPSNFRAPFNFRAPKKNLSRPSNFRAHLVRKLTPFNFRAAFGARKFKGREILRE